MPNNSGIQCRGYIPAFDGLRGFAILLVLFRHMTVIEPSGTSERLIISILDFGWIGVDLFFVLSGFLITGILLDTKDELRYYRTFYARRILRIFPLYYAYLAFVLLVIPFITKPLGIEWPHTVNQDGWWFWSYLSNLYYSLGGSAHKGGLMVTWSLATEEQFYLIWPSVVYLFSRKNLRRICMGLIVGALVLRLGLVFAEVGIFPVYSLLPCRIDTLATGALIAILVRSQISLPRYLQIARLSFVSGLLVIATIWISQETPEYTNRWYQTIGFSALSIVFGSSLWLVLTSRPDILILRILTTKPMLFIGKISYGIYLIHTITIVFVQRFILDPVATRILFNSHFTTQLLFFVLCIALVLFLASLSWHFLEKRFLSLKRVFPYQTQTLSRPVEDGLSSSLRQQIITPFARQSSTKL